MTPLKDISFIDPERRGRPSPRALALIDHMPRVICTIVHEYDSPDAHFREDLCVAFAGIWNRDNVWQVGWLPDGVCDVFMMPNMMGVITRKPFTGIECGYVFSTTHYGPLDSAQLDTLANILAPTTHQLLNPFHRMFIEDEETDAARDRVVWQPRGLTMHAKCLDTY